MEKMMFDWSGTKRSLDAIMDAQHKLDYWMQIAKVAEGESHDCKLSPDSGCQICEDVATYNQEQKEKNKLKLL